MTPRRGEKAPHLPGSRAGLSMGTHGAVLWMHAETPRAAAFHAAVSSPPAETAKSAQDRLPARRFAGSKLRRV